MQQPDRSQVDPNPRSIDDLIPRDHPARMVWEFVIELEVEPLYEKIKAVEGRPGRPPIDPRILVALWLYATFEGVSSARELERLCYYHDAFKWIRGGVDVNYHTLSDFRVGHLEWLEEQIVAIVATMRRQGLIDLNQVGQDGMRVRASAGSSSFKREEKLEEFVQEAQQQWERLQKEFQEGSSKVSARQRAARERAARERLERLEQAKKERKELEAAREKRRKGEGKNARCSPTDPEARIMKMADGGYRPAYNAQLATTLGTLVVVGHDVTQSGNDNGQMDPMVDQIETHQGEVPKEYYTDGGFSTKEDIEAVSRRNVAVFTPVREQEKQKQIREGKDPYAPRAGEGATLTEWRQRMGTDEGKQKYKQRCKCEWTNACFRNWGLQHFTVRGLRKVKAVVAWYVLAHNLVRMVALRALPRPLAT